jgi:hypothetical protein
VTGAKGDTGAQGPAGAAGANGVVPMYEVTPATADVFSNESLSGGAASRTWTSTARYVSLSSTADSGTLNGTADVASFASATQIDTVSITFSGGLGTGVSATVTLYRDSDGAGANAPVSTGKTCNVASNGSSCTISNIGITGITSTDRWQLGVVTSGNSSSRSATTSATGSYVSTPAVAGSAALVSSPKMAVGSGTASTGGTSVTLYGSAVFSNANYRCSVTNTSSTAGLQVSAQTTSGFTVTSSSGSPSFDYMCFGV